MKFFIAFALLAAVASATIVLPANLPESQVAEIQEILAAINSPSTDPATAAMLEQMLLEVLGIAQPQPIEVGPAVVDEYEPIHVGPAIVDEYEPIHVGPAIVDDYHPIQVGPAPTPVAPAPVAPSSPLVQIIVNVKNAQDVGSPVVVDGIEHPVNVVEMPPFPEIVAELPSPVPEIVAELPSPVPEIIAVLPTPLEPVNVAELPTPVEPVIVAPIVVAPAVVAPETLN